MENRHDLAQFNRSEIRKKTIKVGDKFQQYGEKLTIRKITPNWIYATFDKWDYKYKNPRDIHIDIGAHNVKRNPVRKTSKSEYKYSIVQVDTSKSLRVSDEICFVKQKTIANQIANCLNHFAANNIIFRVKDK